VVEKAAADGSGPAVGTLVVTLGAAGAVGAVGSPVGRARPDRWRAAAATARTSKNTNPRITRNPKNR
ncbi:hypothetical protein, partial [Nocardia carnea]|uniref:hypothetical protein n=1 Tax=Nocardia carnea TaxID=37328 RepID=UPI0024579D36